jgi:hypothetical protein
MVGVESLDPFKDLTSKSPEKIIEIEVGKDELVEKAYEAIGKYDIRRDFKIRDSAVESIEDIILSPAQVNMLLQKVIRGQSEKDINEKKAVQYLFAILHVNSYIVGNNDFVLNTGDTIINEFGTLKARKDRPATVSIYGNVGRDFAIGSENVIYNVHGNTGFRSGQKTMDCIFNFYGDVGNYIGIFAENCEFNICGDIITPRISYIATGAKNCTYRAHKKVYDKLCKQCTEDFKENGNEVELL